MFNYTISKFQTCSFVTLYRRIGFIRVKKSVKLSNKLSLNFEQQILCKKLRNIDQRRDQRRGTVSYIPYAF
jgi:hypothetical protein